MKHLAGVLVLIGSVILSSCAQRENAEAGKSAAEGSVAGPGSLNVMSNALLRASRSSMLRFLNRMRYCESRHVVTPGSTSADTHINTHITFVRICKTQGYPWVFLRGHFLQRSSLTGLITTS